VESREKSTEHDKENQVGGRNFMKGKSTSILVSELVLVEVTNFGIFLVCSPLMLKVIRLMYLQIAFKRLFSNWPKIPSIFHSSTVASLGYFNPH
jgi:hypothetical protein